MEEPLIDKALLSQMVARVITDEELLIFPIPISIFGFDVTRWIPAALKKYLTKDIVIRPPFVGTVLRISGKGASITADLNGTTDIQALDYIDTAIDCAGALVENSPKTISESDKNKLQDHITSVDLENMMFSCLSFLEVKAINYAYSLNKSKDEVTLVDGKIKRPEALESLPHYNLGSLLRYFAGAFNENDIKWNLSWNNYMLYLASIPSSDGSSSDTKTETIKTVDAWDLF